MDYDRFIGLVQNRAQLPTTGEAVGAIRAALTTLAERIDAGEAEDLASQLPREIGYYLRAERAPGGERFSFGEFCERVAERECCDLPEAVYHVRCVMEVLGEAVSAGEIRDLRDQLPESYQALFEAGSRGQMRPRESGRRARESGAERERSREERGRWTDDERFRRRSTGERFAAGRDSQTEESSPARTRGRERERESRTRDVDERIRREPLHYSRP